jgi:hypothetical protein
VEFSDTFVTSAPRGAPRRAFAGRTLVAALVAALLLPLAAVAVGTPAVAAETKTGAATTTTTAAPAPAISSVGTTPTTAAPSTVDPVVADQPSDGVNTVAYAGSPWFKPGVAYTANFPDPTVVWDGSKYWAYSTSTGGSLMPAMSSTDLKTWVPRPAYSPNPYNSDPYFNDSFPVPPSWSMGGTSRVGKAQWAPGVVALAGMWVAYTSWEVAPGRRCISVARSSSPAGPFVDNNGGPLVCDSDPGGSIDPQPFIDGNGQAYLLWKASGVPGSAPTKVKSRALSGDGLSFAPGSQAVPILQTELPWDGNSIENPSMVKYNGTYWLIYSGNEWESANYRMGQAACDGPLGPCQRSSGSPLIENTASEWSPGGGTLFVDTANRLRIIYQVWNAPYTSYPTNPNCDGPSLCQTQGQRYYRIDGVAPFAGHLTVDPIGSLDQASLNGNAINVAGWALDPSTTAPITVHVYVDGAAVAITANGSRPDVGAVFPGLGSGHGYTATIGTVPGTHQVCAYGIGVGTPVNTPLGCRTVVVPDSGPFGNLETATTGLGTISVKGWAIDPDISSSITVNLIVDGALTSVTASDDRPDVGAAFPGKGSAHGFSATLSAAGGSRQVCAVGVNVGPGTNKFLGCRTVTVPGGNPIGSLDTATGVSGGVTVGGWAIDPDVASAIQVHVYVDGVGAATTASQTRNDVGTAFPLYGPGHGYTVTVPAAPGTRTACAYGINVATGSVNSLLGCRSVVVPDSGPFGNLESATAGTGTISLKGWAIDPDTSSPIMVNLIVDGVLTTVTADGDRPDVGAAFPGKGSAHGFATVVPAASGSRQVCAIGLNVGPGTNKFLGCRTVVVG